MQATTTSFSCILAVARLAAGKYKVGGEKPYGTRAALFSDDRIRQIEPLIDLMRKIGEERGKSLAQIALNW
jgi:aryl-alcohol dehydrogenase-like predicted oxidoreductase